MKLTESFFDNYLNFDDSSKEIKSLTKLLSLLKIE